MSQRRRESGAVPRGRAATGDDAHNFRQPKNVGWEELGLQHTEQHGTERDSFRFIEAAPG